LTSANQLDELLAIARDLGRNNFLPRAAHYDEAGEFPTENYHDLREAGFLGLVIPTEYGGLGADYKTYATVSAELGQWCGATALTFNMHCSSMLWSGALANDLPMTNDERAAHNQRRAKIYQGVVEEGHIFAQPFSEPNSAAAAGRAPFGTEAAKVEGGFLINGRKHFASLAGHADYYGVLCTLSGDAAPSATNTLYLAVPATASGFAVSGDWNVVGMRPTVSKNLSFTDVFVPDDAQLLPTGHYYHAARNWPHMFMTLCPTYMGIARAAFAFTCQYLRGEIDGGPPASASLDSPVKQLGVAQMRIKLEQADALFQRAIHDAQFQPSKQQRLRAYAAQYTVMEYANELCRDAIRVCGGRSIFKTLRLERLYRDSRCGSLMLPWTPDICLERLGKESLQDPLEF
jgi:alkylation response protein AidB-like acyl-CoA dehydrogenase